MHQPQDTQGVIHRNQERNSWLLLLPGSKTFCFCVISLYFSFSYGQLSHFGVAVCVKLRDCTILVAMLDAFRKGLKTDLDSRLLISFFVCLGSSVCAILMFSLYLIVCIGFVI